MTTSKDLVRLYKPVAGEKIPLSTIVYLEERSKNKAHGLILENLRESGISQAELARRLGKKPEVINRWISTPTNWTIDTITQLLFAINGAEVKWEKSDFLDEPISNFNTLGWLYEKDEEVQDVLYLKDESALSTNRVANKYYFTDAEAIE